MKWLQDIKQKLDEYFSRDDKLVIEGLNDQIDILKAENDTLNKSILLCEGEKDKQKQENELEIYWNNKRPRTNWKHKARPLFESREGSWELINIMVDPRIFFTYDNTLPTFSGTNDEKASLALNWVAKNIKYVTDKEGEFWQFAFETLKRKLGDCEDGAILIANMMIMSGIPYWRIRLNCGEVQGGGHAYLTYLRESDNQWYVMDWCYWYNESKNYQKTWKSAEKYFTIWGSWNQRLMFGDLPKEV